MYGVLFIEFRPAAYHNTLIIPGGGVDGVDGGHDVGDGVQVAGDVQLEHRGQEIAQILLKSISFNQSKNIIIGLTWHSTANSGRLLRAELTTGSCPDSSAPMYPEEEMGNEQITINKT